MQLNSANFANVLGENCQIERHLRTKFGGVVEKQICSHNNYVYQDTVHYWIKQNTYMCEAYKLVKQHMHVDKGNLLCLNMPHQLQGKLSLGPWPCQEVKYF